MKWVLVIFFTLTALGSVVPRKMASQDLAATCTTCKHLMSNFTRRIRGARRPHYFNRTDNAAEKRKTNFTKEELLETLSEICLAGEYSQDCHALAAMAGPLLIEWYSSSRRVSEVYKLICIEKLLLCCDVESYGPNCDACPKVYGVICNGNGRCDGAGTRTGKGTCNCDLGHTGELCDDCSDMFFYYGRTSRCVACSEVNISGCPLQYLQPNQCIEKDQYEFLKTTRKGCPVQECIRAKVCEEDEYCWLDEGDTLCLPCDPSCKSCFSGGSLNCYQCNDGYEMHKFNCTPMLYNATTTTEMSIEEEGDNLEQARYGSYFGLIAIVVIILKVSLVGVWVLSVIFLLYIFFAEMYCFQNGHPGLFVKVQNWWAAWE